MPHRSRVFKTRVLCKNKKKITYSSVFKPYSDFLKPCSGVLLQKICKYQVWEPYGGIFNPYNDVFYAL